MIHKAAIQKFKGSNSLALKSKTLPELVIAQWKKACKPLSQEDATLYIMDLIQSLTQNDVDEIASPSGYKRNCGKKKEDFGKMLRGKIGYLHRFILAKLLILGGKFTCYFKQVSDYSMILTDIQGSGKRVVIFFFHSFSTFLVKYICLICATVTIRRSTTLRYHTIIYTLNRCLNGSLL